MLMSVYLYKDGVEMHKYNDAGNYINGKNPDVQRFRFPEDRLDDVRVLLDGFKDAHSKLEIIFHTEMCSLRETDT